MPWIGTVSAGLLLNLLIEFWESHVEVGLPGSLESCDESPKLRPQWQSVPEWISPLELR